MVHNPDRVNQNADALSRKPINLVRLCPPLETLDLAQAQRQDPVLAKVAECLEVDTSSPIPREWLTYPLKRYKQMITTNTGGLYDQPQGQDSHHGARETGHCGH